MDFIELNRDDEEGVGRMSRMATTIVREHFDPLIGKEQNDYMLAMFQTEGAIKNQMEGGYRYFFVRSEDKDLGFLAFRPEGDAMYLSKFYLYREERGRGRSREMLGFVVEEARKERLGGIELHVNKGNSACRAYEHLGFSVIRSEKRDIGNGFYMDDYVYRLDI